MSLPGIDKESFVPYYYQLKSILSEQIRQGAYQPDELLPSENQLCEMYGVSRATVRKAFAELANEGLVYTVKGKGTFVAKPKLEQSLFRFYALGRDLRSRGLNLVSRMLKQSETALSKEIAQRLKVNPGERAAEIRRVRLVDGAPLALETSYVVGEAVSALATADLEGASIYDVVERATGKVVTGAEEYLEPVIVDGYEAELLECEEGQAAFHIERLAFLDDDRPFEYRTSLIRGDRFRFFVRLR